MSNRFYFDENVSHDIARGLRRREVDVLTSRDDGAAGRTDDHYLPRSVELNHVLVSADPDLIVIARRWQREGRHLPGLVFLPQEQISIGTAVEHLEIVAKLARPEELANDIHFLPL